MPIAFRSERRPSSPEKGTKMVSRNSLARRFNFLKRSKRPQERCKFEGPEKQTSRPTTKDLEACKVSANVYSAQPKSVKLAETLNDKLKREQDLGPENKSLPDIGIYGVTGPRVAGTDDELRKCETLGQLTPGNTSTSLRMLHREEEALTFSIHVDDDFTNDVFLKTYPQNSGRKSLTLSNSAASNEKMEWLEYELRDRLCVSESESQLHTIPDWASEHEGKQDFFESDSTKTACTFDPYGCRSLKKELLRSQRSRLYSICDSGIGSKESCQQVPCLHVETIGHIPSNGDRVFFGGAHSHLTLLEGHAECKRPQHMPNHSCPHDDNGSLLSESHLGAESSIRLERNTKSRKECKSESQSPQATKQCDADDVETHSKPPSYCGRLEGTETASSGDLTEVVIDTASAPSRQHDSTGTGSDRVDSKHRQQDGTRKLPRYRRRFHGDRSIDGAIEPSLQRDPCRNSDQNCKTPKGGDIVKAAPPPLKVSNSLTGALWSPPQLAYMDKGRAGKLEKELLDGMVQEEGDNSPIPVMPRVLLSTDYSYVQKENGDYVRTGWGSYGCVFLGQNKWTHGKVAIKVVLIRNVPGVKSVQEGRTMQWLRGLSCVARFHGVLVLRPQKQYEQFALVTEFIESGETPSSPVAESATTPQSKDLFSLLVAESSARKLGESILSTKQWLELCIDIVKAYSEIHSKQIIVNDIKADNILLQLQHNGRRSRSLSTASGSGINTSTSSPKTKSPSTPGIVVEAKWKPFVIDFGLATHEDGGYRVSTPRGDIRQKLRAGSVYGVGHGQIAPEILDGEISSKASDVFSLGFLLRKLSDVASVPIVDLSERCAERDPAHRITMAGLLSALVQRRMEIMLRRELSHHSPL